MLLDEQARITGGRDGLQYAGAVNTAAHDDHIVFFHLNFPGCGNRRERTKIRECRQSRTAAMTAQGSRRFSSNSTIGLPDVTSISPSTMAPLAMAMARALTRPRITAVTPISSLSLTRMPPTILPATTA